MPRRKEAHITRFIADAVPHRSVILLDGARQVCSTTVIDGFAITSLPAYLLERVGSSGSTEPH